MARGLGSKVLPWVEREHDQLDREGESWTCERCPSSSECRDELVLDGTDQCLQHTACVSCRAEYGRG